MILLLQLRRLTFSSRFEEGERIDISSESSSLASSEGSSDTEMGIAASTIPLKEKNIDGTDTNAEEEEAEEMGDKGKTTLRETEIHHKIIPINFCKTKVM